MASIKSISQFWVDNGVYLFGHNLVGFPFRWTRNRMLAMSFGVKRINIGSGALLRGLSSIEMGENFSSGRGLWLEAVLRHRDRVYTPRLVVGRNVSISAWCHIAATNYVEIGDDVLIGSKVVITDHNHGWYGGSHTSPTIPPNFRPLSCDKEVVISRNVWLGDGVVITPGSRIGEGSIIGANAVVTGTIPPFTIAAGIPAKPLKEYDSRINEWINIK